jgi:hypothetical protein
MEGKEKLSGFGKFFTKARIKEASFMALVYNLHQIPFESPFCSTSSDIYGAVSRHSNGSPFEGIQKAWLAVAFQSFHFP